MQEISSELIELKEWRNDSGDIEDDELACVREVKVRETKTSEAEEVNDKVISMDEGFASKIAVCDFKCGACGGQRRLTTDEELVLWHG